MFTAFRPRRHTTDDKPPTKTERHAQRLSTPGLREWGSQVSLYAAQLLEKPPGHPDEEEGEITEVILALQAVRDELHRRRR